ncbi:MAG: VOC family protein [Flavobacteriaceae bacterium]|nr:VOC family protein [Bacteroidia bacterium]MBT8287473.1 VOC family protein [Bacteroidia bacterium]NNF75948.1 VOC family protein [Flavobacteriaceae bacterium]NNK73872.1 VOC family protein [Flavobacteriaceae bacterium]
MKISSYLTFNGQCEAAMNFYKDVFGGAITVLSRYSDMPAEVCEVSEGFKNHVMHCSLEIDGQTLMGSDTLEPDKLINGNNYNLSININSEEEAHAVFNSLSDGGQKIMKFEDAFWGGKFGMLIDRFGIQWMITSEHKPT